MSLCGTGASRFTAKLQSQSALYKVKMCLQRCDMIKTCLKRGQSVYRARPGCWNSLLFLPKLVVNGGARLPAASSVWVLS